MAKKEPANVLKLIADAMARIAQKPKKGPFIPEATLMNRIQRRRKGK